MKSSRFWIAAPLLAVYAGAASANDELIKLSKDPNQWVMPTGNYANWRYSELNQINKDNVKNLRPLWTFSTVVLRGHEGGPLVIGDIMYIHTPFPNNVFARLKPQWANTVEV
jgi:glucose dehydrogenase